MGDPGGRYHARSQHHCGAAGGEGHGDHRCCGRRIWHPWIHRRIRCATGKRVWRFHTTSGPGEFGSATWAGESWQQGGGATWLTGSYDAELNTL
ncbi:hypothetical protein SBA3_1900003 [Candidatus Sulfopaludibacter sp. SbA3]|nr:hypothetical protein SBA3_1900003 [Candidatus Sulfopaludibacter sp. SbA3]